MRDVSSGTERRPSRVRSASHRFTYTATVIGAPGWTSAFVFASSDAFT